MRYSNYFSVVTLLFLVFQCVVLPVRTFGQLSLGQPTSSPQNGIGDLLIQAELNRAKSDSLKTVWSAQWKKSDSLRIESMFHRMRSDSLLRAANALIAKSKKLRADSIQSVKDEASKLQVESEEDGTQRQPQDTPAQPPNKDLPDTNRGEEVESDDLVNQENADVLLGLTMRARVKASSKKVSSGQTFSDSLTRAIMAVEPDTGMASYYGEAFHGKKTSSGEVYNMHANTCAHRWLPYGTKLRVTNLSNMKSVVVTVTDRGPFKHGRLIDISKNAAKEIDMIRKGTAVVEIRTFED